MVHVEGSEILVLGTMTSFYQIANGALGKGWAKGFAHRYPIPAFSIALAGVSILMPIVIVPIRRKLGLPTNQYNAQHPNVVFPPMPY